MIVTLLLKQAHESGDAERIDVVFDTYSTTSIKDIERKRRLQQSQSIQVMIIQPTHKCPQQWQKYLACDANKNDLVVFIYTEWLAASNSQLIANKIVFLTVGSRCYIITS